MDSSSKLEAALLEWLDAAKDQAKRLEHNARIIMRAVTEIRAGDDPQREEVAPAPSRKNPAVQPEVRRPGFRRLVEREMQRRANRETSVLSVTRSLQNRHGRDVRFARPNYKTDLRGRVAVELGAMRRSGRYPIRSGRAAGTYVYDLTMPTLPKYQRRIDAATTA